MQEATLASIVYTAVLVFLFFRYHAFHLANFIQAHFVVSEEATFGEGFPYQAYYTSLMEQLQAPSERATTQHILDYYNRYDI
jgi:hypothetical protein